MCDIILWYNLCVCTVSPRALWHMDLSEMPKLLTWLTSSMVENLDISSDYIEVRHLIMQLFVTISCDIYHVCCQDPGFSSMQLKSSVVCVKISIQVCVMVMISLSEWYYQCYQVNWDIAPMHSCIVIGCSEPQPEAHFISFLTLFNNLISQIEITNGND